MIAAEPVNPITELKQSPQKSDKRLFWVVRAVAAFAALGIVIATALWQAHHDSRPKQWKLPEKPDSDGVHVDPPVDRSRPFPNEIASIIEGKSTKLRLTGQFTRWRPVIITNVPVYEIAAYDETPRSASAEALLDRMIDGGRQQVYLMRFLMPLSASMLKEAIDHEIAMTFGDVDMSLHGNDVNAFVGTFGHGVSRGDVLYLARTADDMVHGRLGGNTNLVEITREPSVSKAIWRIWAGEYAEPGRKELVRRFAGSAEE